MVERTTEKLTEETPLLTGSTSRSLVRRETVVGKVHHSPTEEMAQMSMAASEYTQFAFPDWEKGNINYCQKMEREAKMIPHELAESTFASFGWENNEGNGCWKVESQTEEMAQFVLSDWENDNRVSHCWKVERVIEKIFDEMLAGSA